MSITRRHLLRGAATVPLLARGATAQPQAVTMVVPYAPGGGTDIVGRSFAQLFSRELDRTVVVENRSGAAGHIGTTSVARARPDGNTLLYSVSTHIVVNPHLQRGAGTELVAAMVPVVQATSYQYVLAADPDLGVSSLAELVALVKSRAVGSMAYSSAGVGSNNHLAAVVFCDAAGIQMEHVPYRGSLPALLDVVAHRVALIFSSPAPAIPLVREGKLRALAVTGDHRMDALPEVPTLSEAGLTGVTITGWHGVFAPGGTPAELMGQYEAAARRAVATEEFRRRIALEGMEPAPDRPIGAFAASVREETAYWGRKLAEMRIRME
ncbi:Bug family tripartite tricarboxylate transporter substrate binding protein [Pararoseomonas indoligenes]|uniref:Tripartite tricarboxylate transporter substrate binding protein n=1 Tax=Roseomonas indoligenes TaxID=2820811 RepID=A0A940S7Q2_9PROT|nr:tripartite tricarboxylate transporter substrate-binding protein [Pararoseomonas indoligenes]MBP0495160.1 tripartite tricarboxylate transporter substrate binding protein [Pararoseomonas indoligenes]